MHERIDYWHLGTRYTLVAASRAADHGVAHASRFEARSVLEAMAREEPMLLQRVCRALDEFGPTHRERARLPADLSAPQVEKVLRALGEERFGEGRGTAPAFARLYLLREPETQRRSSVQDGPEAEAIDRAISQLGRDALQFQGRSYRLSRGETQAKFPGRERYETLSEQEALSILRTWVAAPECPAAHQAALAELLALADAQREKSGRTELVLLRQERSYVRPPEESAAVTPSALKSAHQPHWIEIEALDKDKLPIRGVTLEVLLASGGTTQVATNELGLARLDNLQAGNLSVRVLAMDGSAWRPLSGAPASASSKQPGALTHVVTRGECVEKIAQRYGIKDWRALWDDSKNAALKKRRKNPHVLQPGDKLVVSPRVFEIACATDARHTIEVARAEKRVRVCLRTLGDGALKNIEYDYSYKVGDKLVEKPGSAPTDDRGMLEENVPVTVHRIHVRLRELGLRLSYDVSSLEPARDDDTQSPLQTGIRQRLYALGFDVSRDARAGQEDQSALSLFQQLSLKRTSANGDPDEETLGALERAHTA